MVERYTVMLDAAESAGMDNSEISTIRELLKLAWRHQCDLLAFAVRAGPYGAGSNGRAVDLVNAVPSTQMHGNAF
jgi:hypothetical protein